MTEISLRMKMNFEYPQNVRFKCIKCGICCGDTKERMRHILLLDEEATLIASTTKMPISDFAAKSNEKTPYHYEMKKNETDGKCIFLKENRCSIYSKRPLICRFYPFGLVTNKDRRKIFYFTSECIGMEEGKTMKENDFQKLLEQANKRTMAKRGNGF
jgi:Fe-S-cluster containining protein